MKTDERYDVAMFQYTPALMILNYFEKLEEANLLEDRLSEHKNPTVQSFVDLLQREGNKFYFVIDRVRREIVGEFNISDTLSEVGLVHFSMSPVVKANEVFHIIRNITNDILLKWKKRDSDEPYLQALVGMTPVENKRACLVIQRCGFKKIATVPFAGRYKNECCDGLFTIKRRDELLNNS